VSMRAAAVVAMAIVAMIIGYTATAVPGPVTHIHPVTTDRERCVAPMGSSFLQFSAYQARTPQTRYCKQIPEVGPATIVIDQGDADLRDMTTDVRIIKDVYGAAAAAERTEMSHDAVVASTVLDPLTERHVPPEVYPTGIIEFAHTFTSPGPYLVMVTAKNDHGQVFVSEFPFRVGPAGYGGVLLWGGAAGALVVASLLLAWKYGVFRRLLARGGRR